VTARQAPSHAANQFGRLRAVVETNFGRRSPAIRALIRLETALVCENAITPSEPPSPDKRLIPCNLRTRRLLGHSDLYRGFESTHLRHAVWTTENPSCIPQIIAGKPVFSYLSLANRAGENLALYFAGMLSCLFLWRALWQSGFIDCAKRMQSDHKPMVPRKRLDFRQHSKTSLRNARRRLPEQPFAESLRVRSFVNSRECQKFIIREMACGC
jgi:hypothetical protein